jgi:tRNA pseudouridine38-40 synthase
VLGKIASHPVKVMAASRTDAGVHARGQVATFFLEGSIPVDQIPTAVNGILPKDIVVTAAEEVADDFHCRHNAVGKHYRYTVRNSSLPSPFDYRYVYAYRGSLDLVKVQAATAVFIGEHDFEAFTASHSGRMNFVRRLDQITVNREGEYIHLDFWGGGFLYKMVRNIAGCLIDIGRGHFDVDVAQTALKKKDRSLLSLTAPARGLTLIKIYYNDEYFLDKERAIR